jgi:5'-phosphate synthase pdxT subunit
MTYGILALQGDYYAHGRVLDRLGHKYIYVKTPADLDRTDGLIIPGGESTTMRKLAKSVGLWEKLGTYDKPIMGTCTGIILIAKRIENPLEEGLNLLDITINRNAYGSQINSFTAIGDYVPESRPLEMVFIRAPKIESIGNGVEIIARLDNEPVGVRKGNIIGLTFHPELTDDLTLHRMFCDLSHL